ncbi:hypothetical protein JOC24_005363 [Streptomyces sp. HB132]|nr:hypothetical protein [Streptomyces sp. HB132]
MWLPERAGLAGPMVLPETPDHDHPAYVEARPASRLHDDPDDAGALGIGRRAEHLVGGGEGEQAASGDEGLGRQVNGMSITHDLIISPSTAPGLGGSSGSSSRHHLHGPGDSM